MLVVTNYQSREGHRRPQVMAPSSRPATLPDPTDCEGKVRGAPRPGKLEHSRKIHSTRGPARSMIGLWGRVSTFQGQGLEER